MLSTLLSIAKCELIGNIHRRVVDLAFKLQDIKLQYDWSEDVTVGVAYEYLDAGEAEIDQEGGSLKGPLKEQWGRWCRECLVKVLRGSS